MPRRRAAADERVGGGARDQHPMSAPRTACCGRWRGAVISSSAQRRATTRLAPACSELGSAYAGNQDLLRRAPPHLEALRDQVQETIHLGILSDGDVVEMCNAGGGQPVSVSMERPAAAIRRTARRSARCCWPALPEAEVDRFFARGPLTRAHFAVDHQPRAADEGDRARAPRWLRLGRGRARRGAVLRRRAGGRRRRPRHRRPSPSPCRRCASSRSASRAG